MRATVFYSWQNDLPGRVNRSFIETALQKAVKLVRRDESIGVDPSVDRDTLGVAGAPDIARTIFSKIRKASAFVADVSLINHKSRKIRKMPNPNVLVELGYAFGVLGEDQVILVFNRAYGKIENLPFDLRNKRVVTYDLAETAPEKSGEREKLVGVLRSRLEEVFKLAPSAARSSLVQVNWIARRDEEDDSLVETLVLHAPEYDDFQQLRKVLDTEVDNREGDPLVKLVSDHGRKLGAYRQSLHAFAEKLRDPNVLRKWYVQDHWDRARRVSLNLDNTGGTLLEDISLRLELPDWLAAYLDRPDPDDTLPVKPPPPSTGVRSRSFMDFALQHSRIKLSPLSLGLRGSSARISASGVEFDVDRVPHKRARATRDFWLIVLPGAPKEKEHEVEYWLIHEGLQDEVRRTLQIKLVPALFTLVDKPHGKSSEA